MLQLLREYVNIAGTLGSISVNSETAESYLVDTTRVCSSVNERSADGRLIARFLEATRLDDIMKFRIHEIG